MELTEQIIRLIGSLALVLGIFLAFIYGLKRWGSGLRKTGGEPGLEVVSRLSFGPRHYLVLVRVPGGQKALIGVSPQGMNFLTTVREDLAARAATEPAEAL